MANALQHGDGEVVLTGRPDDDAVVLEVSDEGGGFPDAFAAHAFERFARADEARTGGGAGLGLAIVAVVATAHGGPPKRGRDGDVAAPSVTASCRLRHAPRMNDGYAWIEGEYVPIAEARIPILDTGFVRSDLTYDVVGVWGGSFFRLDDHLDRLERGCERIRLQSPLTREETVEVLTEVVRRSGLREAYVEAVVTRGVPARGERDPRRLQPRFYAYAIPYVWLARPEQQETGVDVVVARETRRMPPRWSTRGSRTSSGATSSAGSSRPTTATRSCRSSPTPRAT